MTNDVVAESYASIADRIIPLMERLIILYRELGCEYQAKQLQLSITEFEAIASEYIGSKEI